MRSGIEENLLKKVQGLPKKFKKKKKKNKKSRSFQMNQ